MISDLIIYACLVANPSVCERHVVASDQTVMACQNASIISAAKWTGEHPGWRVRRVECRSHVADA